MYEDNDRWEEDCAERYEEYLQEYCTTHGPDDDEYLTYEEFREEEMDRMSSYWDDMSIEELEEALWA